MNNPERNQNQNGIRLAGLILLTAFLPLSAFGQAVPTVPAPTEDAAGAAALRATPSPTPAASRPSAGPSPSPTPAAITSRNREAQTPIPGAVKLTLPLRRLIEPKGTIMLRNDRAIYTLFVPVAARFKVARCKFYLSYTNSTALLDRSVMAITLNDRIIKQVKLDAANPSATVEIDVPIDLMKNDFNQLQFIVAQSSVEKCQDPNAPELYTQIDPDQSYFEAEMVPQPVPSRLSALRDIIDEKLWYPYPFHIVFPDSTAKEDSVLSWGSVVSQGIALSLGVQPFRITHANSLRPGMDNIVIGTMNTLTPFLTSTEINAINGSFIGVKPMRDDPNNYMIILSGRSEEEVGQAVLAFSLVNYPLPDAQFALIDRLALPFRAMYVRNAPFQDPGSYTLESLGIRTRTIRGFNTGSFQIPMYMPGDLSPRDRSNVELRLNFVYGAALRSDSVVNFFINDTFHTAIRLKDVNGALHLNHRLYVPTASFQPGRNVLSIAPVMVPSVTNECELWQVENLQFTLYEDSELVIPGLARGATLPSLGLLSQTAFPYSASPDGVDTAVWLTSRDPDNLNAAWTLMGKMAQISGALMHRAEVSFRNSRSRNNLLVIGPVDSIPDEVVQNATVSPREVGKMRYMIETSPVPTGTALPSALEDLINKLGGRSEETVSRLKSARVVEMDTTATLDEEIVAVQYQSPFKVGHALTLVTAPDSPRLLAGMNVLQQREVWDNLTGDLAVWGMDPSSLQLAKVSDEFTYGATTVIEQAKEGLGRQPLVFAIVIMLALAAVGFLARLVLRRQKQRDLDPEP